MGVPSIFGRLWMLDPALAIVSIRTLIVNCFFLPRSALAVNFATIIDTRHFIFTNPNTGFGLCPWKGVLCFDECMVVQDYGIKHVTQVSTSEGVFIVGITNTHVVVYKLFIRGICCLKFLPIILVHSVQFLSYDVEYNINVLTLFIIE